MFQILGNRTYRNLFAAQIVALLGTGLATVADDSGLVVDALNGMPGVLSARWAGRHGDDRANLELVLAQLADVPADRRGAGFVIFDMRVAVAQDRPGRRAQHGEADAVGGGPGGHPQRLDLALEHLPEGGVEPRAILVGVIGRLEPVRGADRCDHRRARRSGIVGKEKIGHRQRMTRRLARVNWT